MTYTLENPLQSKHDNCLYAPEMSRVFSVKTLKEHPAEFHIEATDIERAALATRFHVSAIHSLKGSFKIYRKNGLIKVKGSLEAQLDQTCVVTLNSFKVAIVDDFNLVFDPSTTWDDFCLDETFFSDGPEPIINNQLDIGELLAQQLSLGINPYPRSPGANLAEAIKGINVSNVKVITEATQANSPFAVLKELGESA